MGFREKRNKQYPITLSLARQHLRMGDSDHDDALIEQKLEMAIGVAEDMTGRYILGYEVDFDVLLTPDNPVIKMPVHTESVMGIFSPTHEQIPVKDYTLIVSEYSAEIVVTNTKLYGMALTVKALIGYSESSLPPGIKAAILLILGTLYDNESDNIVGRSVSKISLTAEKLLRPWRINPYGDV